MLGRTVSAGDPWADERCYWINEEYLAIPGLFPRATGCSSERTGDALKYFLERGSERSRGENKVFASMTTFRISQPRFPRSLSFEDSTRNQGGTTLRFSQTFLRDMVGPGGYTSKSCHLTRGGPKAETGAASALLLLGTHARGCDDMSVIDSRCSSIEPYIRLE